MQILTRKRNQRGALSLSDLFLAAVAMVLLYQAFLYVPHYYTKHKLDKMILATLDEWKETDSVRKAEVFLNTRMEAGDLPGYLSPKKCKLRVQGLQRHIECEWHLMVKDRLFQSENLLKFTSHKYLNANGLLEDEE